VERCRWRAIRLLGLESTAPPLEQPIREAAEAELRRLARLRDELAADPTAGLRADLALFGSDPESHLLIRYEAAAERELHRAVTTFLKLRKDPELVDPPAPPAPEAAPAEATPFGGPQGVPPGNPGPVGSAGLNQPGTLKARTRRLHAPARNEATTAERRDPDRPGPPARAGSPAARRRRR
jgi:hypothetical protein